MRTKLLLSVALWTVCDFWAMPALADGSGAGSGSWIGYLLNGNQATGINSAVVAGANNFAGAQGAFVGSGTANQATALSSMVLGGFDNRAINIDALVGAGAGNRASGVRSIVVGGGYNLAAGHFSFIGGGGRSTVDTVPAGTHDYDNVTSRKWTIVVGGVGNEASGDGAVVVGGGFNTASGVGSFVGGGGLCCANDQISVWSNIASGFGSVITGGYLNNATGAVATISGGSLNTANNFATVPGGVENSATGEYSFAAGRRARADAARCVAFSLWAEPFGAGMPCFGVAGIFAVGAPGGYAFDFGVQRDDGGGTAYVAFGRVGGQHISTSTGAFLTSAGVWVNASSATASKTDFAQVDTTAVLAKVTALPISTWRYREGEGDVRHMGPMAEDFWSAFGIGYGAHTIADLDARGVALAAIQGLNAKLEAQLAERDATIAAQASDLAALRRAVDSLLARAFADGQLAAPRTEAAASR